MFSLRDFVMQTIGGMIGNYPDFQAMEYGLNWYSKGVLAETDLAEIQEGIENRKIVVDEPEVESEPEETEMEEPEMEPVDEPEVIDNEQNEE